ncbi:MAG: PH domain-containing protein [Acidimicrobiia bacterium]
MPYPKHLLKENETLVLDLKPHWWYFSRHILTGIPLFFLIILVFTLPSGTGKDLLLWVVAALLVAWGIWLLFKYIEWTFTHFVVTSDRVIFRTGVFAKHGVEIPLQRINNINFHQGIWERVIGAGDLIIESAGEQGQSDFENVRHPDGVQQEIYRVMDAKEISIASARSPVAAAAPAPAAASVPEQIQQLATLRDAGTITPEEFEAKKAELLKRM